MHLSDGWDCQPIGASRAGHGLPHAGRLFEKGVMVCRHKLLELWLQRTRAQTASKGTTRRSLICRGAGGDALWPSWSTAQGLHCGTQQCSADNVCKDMNRCRHGQAGRSRCWASNRSGPGWRRAGGGARWPRRAASAGCRPYPRSCSHTTQTVGKHGFFGPAAAVPPASGICRGVWGAHASACVPPVGLPPLPAAATCADHDEVVKDHDSCRCAMLIRHLQWRMAKPPKTCLLMTGLTSLTDHIKQTTPSSTDAEELARQWPHHYATACSRLCSLEASCCERPSASPKSSVPPHAYASLALARSPCAAACSSLPVSQVASSPVALPWHSVKGAIQVLHQHHVPSASHVSQTIGLQAGHCKVNIPEGWNALRTAQPWASRAVAHHLIADPA